MSQVSGRIQVKEEYSQDHVADEYIKNRFDGDPMGQALHERQLAIVRQAIVDHAPRRILEIAPGPARLTAEVDPGRFGCAVELSPSMARVARDRLAGSDVTGWRLIRGDGFELPVRSSQVDMVMTFRFIRHFAPEDRRKLLGQIRRVLRPGGRLLLDVVNREMFDWLLRKIDHPRPRVEDYWFTEDSFRKEMTDLSFHVEAMEPVHPALPLQYYIWSQAGRRSPALARSLSRIVPLVTDRFPLEWVALCRCA